MYAVSNTEARRAARLFEDLEGIDISTGSSSCRSVVDAGRR